MRCNFTAYLMITTCKHKGLQIFWDKGIATKLPADQRSNLRLILDTLNDAGILPQDLLPFKSWRIHQMHGSRSGEWSLTVKENWCIVFKFEDTNAFDIDYPDYHQ